MSEFKGCFTTVVLFLLLWFILSLVSGVLIYLLWNWVIVWLFCAPVVTFWKAWGIGVILGLIGSIFRKN